MLTFTIPLLLIALLLALAGWVTKRARDE